MQGYMNDRSKKSPKKRKKNNNHKQSETIKEVEYYLNNDGNDTRIIRNIAVSSMIPTVGSDRQKQFISEYELLGVPFFTGIEDELLERNESNPFWSFTMMVKDSGDHKLLFSSQEDAEQFYTEILKN